MLNVETFVASEGSFMSSAHLISGERDSILADASFTKSDAQQLAEMVRASGKRLTTVFITHAHPDHFLGLPVVLEASPDARVVATAAVAEAMQVAAPQYHRTYGAALGDAIADTYVVAEPLTTPELDLEGETIQVIEIGPGEADVSSALYIPSLKAIVSGDQIFSGVHVWLVEYRPQGSLDGIRRLREAGPIEIVLPGHGPAGGPELLDENERYIQDFMTAAESAGTKDDAVTAVLQDHGDLAMPVILDFGMQAAVEGRSYPEIMQSFLSGNS